MNAYVLDSVAQDRWVALLQRAWTARLTATRTENPDAADQRQRSDAAARLREHIRAYEGTQPSYAADLAAALTQLEGHSVPR